MKNKTRENDSDGYGFLLLWVVVLLIPWVFLHSGCAVWPEPARSVHIGVAGPMGSCADFFASVDKRTTISNALDSGHTRVTQYPYLRTNRFLASFRDEVETGSAFTAWVDQMQALDQWARRFEIANLSDPDVAALASVNGRNELYRKVVACGNLLRDVDFSNADEKKRLRRDAAAVDEYIGLRRVLGLYPVTDRLVLRGVRQWHAEANESFGTKPPEKWQAIRYVPPVEPDVLAGRRIVQRAERDALGIPAYAPEDRETLFHAYAPVWEVPVKSDDDRIGSPIWTGDGRIGVDTDRPRTYTHLSLTRSGRAILTQLNYIIWFPSRPKDGVLDIYGGMLDGLNYRVTLDTKGDPILYETIHNCGCYYKAYPTGRLRVREPGAYAEPPLILQAPEIDFTQEPMAVAMESRTHYVRHLYPASRGIPSETVTSPLADYDELKSLDHGNGNRKSMFNRYGIVPGSQRLERFVLWPTGVLSPGAMRQWGRHAVAFVGKRHFDDPFYLDRMFSPTDSF